MSKRFSACSEFHDLEPVSRAAGFNIRSDGSAIRDLCAVLLGKRFRRVQKRRATAANVSRDVAIKIAFLWIEGMLASQPGSIPVLPQLPSLEERHIQQLPPVNVSSSTKVLLTATEAKSCADKILAAARTAGGDVR